MSTQRSQSSAIQDDFVRTGEAVTLDVTPASPPERFAAAYDRCVHGEKTCVTQEEKTEFMLRWLEKIVRHLEIPTSLSAFGVPASDLETLVAAGMQVTRLLNNNLRPVTADDARALYRRIL